MPPRRNHKTQTKKHVENDSVQSTDTLLKIATDINSSIQDVVYFARTFYHSSVIYSDIIRIAINDGNQLSPELYERADTESCLQRSLDNLIASANTYHDKTRLWKWKRISKDTQNIEMIIPYPYIYALSINKIIDTIKSDVDFIYKDKSIEDDHILIVEDKLFDIEVESIKLMRLVQKVKCSLKDTDKLVSDFDKMKTEHMKKLSSFPIDIEKTNHKNEIKSNDVKTMQSDFIKKFNAVAMEEIRIAGERL
jgi:hypothetical protein